METLEVRQKVLDIIADVAMDEDVTNISMDVALREQLESLSLEEGYKIYNHECYTSFIKEILNKSDEGEQFDKLRKMRNKINYYGIDVEMDEAENIIKKLQKLIKIFSK